jgi:hypothetical protein
MTEAYVREIAASHSIGHSTVIQSSRIRFLQHRLLILSLSMLTRTSVD